VREHDPFAFEGVAVRHQRLIRDVRWIIRVEEGRVADEEIRAFRDPVLARGRIPLGASRA